ncbi:MAG: hypothetical protein ACNA8J_01000 [Gammaproteobacteria bacterium]
MKTTALVASALAAVLLATVAASPRATVHAAAPPHPADAFLERLASHCGESFAGKIVANKPAMLDDPFAGQPLVMHVRECSPTEVRVPLHVGNNHSRTWILTRTDAGLRLKHDHRHEDGSDDAVTMYGGESTKPGTAVRQVFPIDEYSIAMFLREGLDISVTNIWAMEIEPGERFLYELARPEQGRLFQVEFDLATPVATPPTPWGYPELD